jgi:aminoglycoside phosphotransferase (APT) family kinase protein
MGAADRDLVLREFVGPDGAITGAAAAVAARFRLGQVRRVATLPGAGDRNALITTEAGSWVLRLGLDPSTLGGPSSRLPTALDVLRNERFFAGAITRTSSLRSPWPYEIDDNRDLLPVPYAVMPRLPGLTLWWSEGRDWGAVGTALAEAALDLHRESWPAAGYWDPRTNDITPSQVDPADACRVLVGDLIERTAVTSEPLDGGSRDWIADCLVHLDADAASGPCLVHGDLVIGNVCMGEDQGRWSVTGIFDFENARIGDPEEDVVVHLWWACYGGRPEAAVSFLRRYRQERSVSRRIYGYLVASLLGNWEYGRRMGFPWYGRSRTFRDWAAPLYTDFERVVSAAVD